jgi:hypothetical protein
MVSHIVFFLFFIFSDIVYDIVSYYDIAEQIDERNLARYQVFLAKAELGFTL